MNRERRTTSDDDDDDQIWDVIDSLDVQVANEEAIKAITNEQKELADLFQSL